MMMSKTAPPATIKFSLKPYPLQQEIADDKHRFKVVIIGRQAGKSWLARYSALDGAVNRKSKVLWVSPTAGSARTHWNALTSILVRSKLPCNILKATREIFFPNGGYINLRSAHEPDSLRGESVDLLILDEASYFKDGEYAWSQVLLPMVTATKGKIILLTTPRGKDWVYDLYKLGQDTESVYYKSWQVSSYVSPYQDTALLDSLQQTLPATAFREEYLAEFLDDRGGVFTGVKEAMIGEWHEAPRTGRQYVIGVDWGSTKDSTVVAVLDYEARALVHLVRFTGVAPNQQIERIVTELVRWQPLRSFIERLGVGETYYQLLRERLGDAYSYDQREYGEAGVLNETLGGYRISAVSVNNMIKRQMIERLANDITRKQFILPEKDPYNLMTLYLKETEDIERIQTEKIVTYKALTSHDDMVIATALAYKGIPPKRRDNAHTFNKSPFRR